MIRAALMTIILVAVSAPMAAAQDDAEGELGTGIRIRSIVATPGQWDNRQVTIYGMVERFADTPSEDGVGFFYLKDMFGDAMLVRTTATMPDPRVLYRSTGVVSLMQGGTPYLSEEGREVLPMQAVEVVRQAFANAEVVDAAAIAQRTSQVTETPQSNEIPPVTPTTTTTAATDGDTRSTRELLVAAPWFWMLLLGGIILIAAVIWYVSQSRRSNYSRGSSLGQARPSPQASQLQPRPEPVAAGGVASGAAPQFGGIVDGKTVKFHAPPPGTVKVLAGHFEVQGEDQDQGLIRLFGDGDETEITFGRTEGEPYEHVQLKVPSVSRLQARVRVRNGTYEIKNESSTNPTRVNGRSVDGWKTLDEGDRVEMGEVSFLFHNPV